jgi:hypothetical protein
MAKSKDDKTARRIHSQRKRAVHLAGAVIDHKADNRASADNQAIRKRRLVEGPAEFRTVRVDRSTKKRSTDS